MNQFAQWRISVWWKPQCKLSWNIFLLLQFYSITSQTKGIIGNGRKQTTRGSSRSRNRNDEIIKCFPTWKRRVEVLHTRFFLACLLLLLSVRREDNPKLLHDFWSALKRPDLSGTRHEETICPLLFLHLVPQGKSTTPAATCHVIYLRLF